MRTPQGTPGGFGDAHEYARDLTGNRSSSVKQNQTNITPTHDKTSASPQHLPVQPPKGWSGYVTRAGNDELLLWSKCPSGEFLNHMNHL